MKDDEAIAHMNEHMNKSPARLNVQLSWRHLLVRLAWLGELEAAWIQEMHASEEATKP